MQKYLLVELRVLTTIARRVLVLGAVALLAFPMRQGSPIPIGFRPTLSGRVPGRAQRRFAGVHARFDRYLEHGYTVIVLSHYDAPAADEGAERLGDSLLPD